MKIKKRFNYNIFKVIKNRFLFVNKRNLNITICIMRENKKCFLITNQKFSIPKNKVEKKINKYYNKLI